MSQDLKCFLGVHKYKIFEQKDIKNSYGIVVGTTVISQCANCGKVKEKRVYTDTSQIN